MDPTRIAISDFLDETRHELVDLVKSLTPEELGTFVHEGGWTVKDMISHVATSEAGLVSTAKRIADGQPHASPGFDIHRFNQRQAEKHRETSVDDLLAGLEVSREAARRALAEYTDAQMATPGFMSSGTPIDVLGVFRRIGQHEREHCQEILKVIGR